MGASPTFAALSHPLHRRKWLHVTCASGDIKCVYTWAAERGVECPKLTMTCASTVLCNQGLQGLITGDMRQDIRICQHPGCHSSSRTGAPARGRTGDIHTWQTQESSSWLYHTKRRSLSESIKFALSKNKRAVFSGPIPASILYSYL